MDVLILAGGLSHERDVSIRSGRRVAEALKGVGVKVDVRDVDSGLIPYLRGLTRPVVWPLLHGASGEDGSLQDVLEMCGVRYVGTDPRAARVAWSKPVAKTVVHRAGVATPEYVTLPASLFRELGAENVLDAVVDRLGLPLVVKPARGGSALGVSTVTSRDDLPRAMVDCFAYGDVALLELRSPFPSSATGMPPTRSRRSKSSPRVSTTTTPATTLGARSTSPLPASIPPARPRPPTRPSQSTACSDFATSAGRTSSSTRPARLSSSTSTSRPG